LLLKLTRVTVARKLAFLAKEAEQRHDLWLETLPKAKEVQFDDLITIEHTKCKPLAISLAVESGTRRILGFEVSSIPASGPLAALSRNKYGPRRNMRPLALQRLFNRVRKALDPAVSFQSDEDPLYPPLVRRNFPGSAHFRHPGGRGCISGQGELKKLIFDPLFSLNHTCAMLRANINRLFRRTWCTTKKPECLCTWSSTTPFCSKPRHVPQVSTPSRQILWPFPRRARIRARPKKNQPHQSRPVCAITWRPAWRAFSLPLRAWRHWRRRARP
jgi:hypothetical protein